MSRHFIVSFPSVNVVIVTRGLNSITIPDGVNVTHVIGNITIPGGVSHCTWLAKKRVIQAYGAVCTPVCPYPM